MSFWTRPRKAADRPEITQAVDFDNRCRDAFRAGLTSDAREFYLDEFLDSGWPEAIAYLLGFAVTRGARITTGWERLEDPDDGAESAGGDPDNL